MECNIKINIRSNLALSRMRLSRSTTTALAAVAASSPFTAKAFSSSGSEVTSRLIANTLKKKAFAAAKHHPKISSTALPMIFDNLFATLGGGGGFGSKIEYDNMPFPVPELASMAMEGKASDEIEKDGKMFKVATFAGGCFWGLELAYQRVPGVQYTAVGYTQGPETEPNYDAVCAGATKHTEAVIALYDPKECSYETLLDTFFDRVDPLTVNGQGSDRGTQYRTGVYYHSAEQEEIARARFAAEQKKYKRSIATECARALPFWPAEKYHQQYLEKGGRFNSPQSAEKSCEDTIRCYG